MLESLITKRLLSMKLYQFCSFFYHLVYLSNHNVNFHGEHRCFAHLFFPPTQLHTKLHVKIRMDMPHSHLPQVDRAPATTKPHQTKPVWISRLRNFTPRPLQDSSTTQAQKPFSNATQGAHWNLTSVNFFAAHGHLRFRTRATPHGDLLWDAPPQPKR